MIYFGGGYLGSLRAASGIFEDQDAAIADGTSESSQLAITSITSVGGVTWELPLKGEASTHGNGSPPVSISSGCLSR